MRVSGVEGKVRTGDPVMGGGQPARRVAADDHPARRMFPLVPCQRENMNIPCVCVMARTQGAEGEWEAVCVCVWGRGLCCCQGEAAAKTP
ncbi:hypothetical protein E2C01_040554 [Portunus trituberculatus]|uniref:Uncharacterized protein n=1 Tax=Portunus trituberculatus TaxID=210409 RepID=A0A5B7FR35_PORTR|nr:hypothetical protein [Portunus trituberculatus]